MRNFPMLYVFLFGLVSANQAFASPNQILIRSRIVKPDGNALEAAAVQFRLSVTDPSGACVLFQEDFANQDMSASKGFITLSLGGGTKSYPSGAMTMATLFNDFGSHALTCVSGSTYTPGANDARQLVMQFNDGTGWQTVPASPIKSVPYALEALTTHKLGDYSASDYVRLASFPTCTAAQALFFNGTALSCVAVSSGSGTVTGVTSANADIGITNGTTTPQLTLNSGTGANQIVKLNGSSQLPAVSGVNITSLNASNLASGTVPAAQMPALTGDVTSTAGTVATTISGLARSKLANGTANHVLINDGSGGMSSEAALAVSRGGTAATSFATNAVILSNGTGTALTALNCSSGQVIKFDASGFAGCGAAGSSQWSTSSNDIYYNTGNVGIGTTNPTARLTTRVNATGDVGLEVQNSSGSQLFRVKDDGFGYGEMHIYNNAGTSRFSVQGNPSAGPTIAIDGTSGNTTDSFSGWGGIAAFIGVNNVVGQENGLFFGSGGGKGAGITHYVSGLGSPGEGGLKFKTSQSSGTPLTRMTITETGNVGVGTTSPSGKFSVKQESNSATAFNITNSSNNSIFSVGTDHLGAASLSFNDQNGGQLIGFLGSNGALGPRISVPGAPHLGDGSGNYYGAAMYIGIPAVVGSENGLYFGNSGNIIGAAITSYTTSTSVYGMQGLHFKTSTNASTTTRMTIDDTGKVGIGTTGPTAKLEVQGQIRSTGASGAANVNSSAAVDWNNGNTQSMSVACTSTTLSNMLDGGTYLLAVTETGTTTCAFSHTGLTFYYSPANGARTSGQRTVYSFQRIGNDVYVSWVAGFQ